MAILKKLPVTASLELGIVHQLSRAAALKNCAIVAKHETSEAPSNLPCVIVHCESAERFGDVVEYTARTASVSATLYADTEQTSESDIEKMAREIELHMDSRAALQPRFNAPTSGRDYRKVKGIHLHEVLDTSVESSADGTTYAHAVTSELIIQEISE